ncbi:hypothetical protein PUV44_09110 [Xanthomonas arboricola pv. corylina]|nr:hypothetical protein PUV44_09110 [Xanthomonas arboricola pv. corylina]
MPAELDNGRLDDGVALAVGQPLRRGLGEDALDIGSFYTGQFTFSRMKLHCSV